MQTSVTGREGVRRRHEEQTLSSKWGAGGQHRGEHTAEGRTWAAGHRLADYVVECEAFWSVLETTGCKFERNRIFIVSRYLPTN